MKMPLDLDYGHLRILRCMYMIPWPKRVKSGPWHDPISTH